MIYGWLAQRLKALWYCRVSARLKACPDTSPRLLEVFEVALSKTLGPMDGMGRTTLVWRIVASAPRFSRRGGREIAVAGSDAQALLTQRRNFDWAEVAVG